MPARKPTVARSDSNVFHVANECSLVVGENPSSLLPSPSSTPVSTDSPSSPRLARTHCHGRHLPYVRQEPTAMVAIFLASAENPIVTTKPRVVDHPI
ncbi:hypothetical protein ACLOJK_027817 [Asimina triloba]